MGPSLPRQFIDEMAQRRRRFHHYLWHRMRNAWSRLPEAERWAVFDVNPAWAPPRAALDASCRPLRDNDSGEDFFYMHRQMLALANDILAHARDPAHTRVEGWRRVPPPGDVDYPVPEFSDSELWEVKSAAYFERVIAPWERRYTDPGYLRGVTLGQFGSDIEFTIQTDMLVRWAAPSAVGYRLPTTPARGIHARWDAPAYDYLGDTYSCHVNPIFWKIRGWVEDRLEDWKRAHRITGEIEWKGTWVGPPLRHEPPGVGAADAAGAQDEARRIDGIISASSAAVVDGFIWPTPRPRKRL